MTSQTTLKLVNRNTRIPRTHKKFNAVILGAGFSAEYGYPLAGQLLRDIYTYCSPGSQNIKDLIRFLIRFYQDYEQENSKYPDIEDFLGMLDVAKQYANIRSSNRGYYWRERKVTELEIGIKRMINDYLWSFQQNNLTMDLSKINKMIEFFGRNTIYVNFNYDLLLETALSKSGIEYCYGISEDPEVISILKPHGSINWFYQDRFKVHQPVELKKYGENFLIANTLDFTDIKKCKGRDPVIISPTPNKKIEDSDLKRIWTGFSSTMTQSKALYIIGYSLPSADRLARLVTRRAAHEYQKRKKIIIIRRSNQEAHYQKCISPLARQIESSFGDWALTLE